MSNAFFEGSKLLLATHNEGKIKEISDLLSPYVDGFVTSSDLNLEEPEETGTTFAENAILKAKISAEESGLPALADDSGLAVTALNGDPGIFSARWAGPDRDFGLAMQKVQDALGDTEDRSASFICVLALALPVVKENSIKISTFEGRVNGNISWPPRGSNGFGYDPVFIPDGYSQTFGEMDRSEKRKISHRAMAFKRLVSRCFR